MNQLIYLGPAQSTFVCPTGADPRRRSLESGSFSSRLECEACLWLLANELLSLSDGVCAFFGKWTQSFLVRKE